MNEYMIQILIILCFLILFWSHYAAIKIGFKMGSQTDFNKVQSSETKITDDIVYDPGPSDLDKEALDYE